MYSRSFSKLTFPGRGISRDKSIMHNGNYYYIIMAASQSIKISLLKVDMLNERHQLGLDISEKD